MNWKGVYLPHRYTPVRCRKATQWQEGRLRVVVGERHCRLCCQRMCTLEIVNSIESSFSMVSRFGARVLSTVSLNEYFVSVCESATGCRKFWRRIRADILLNLIGTLNYRDVLSFSHLTSISPLPCIMFWITCTFILLISYKSSVCGCIVSCPMVLAMPKIVTGDFLAHQNYVVYV